MNKEQTIKAIEIMQAYVDGAEIEFRHFGSKEWTEKMEPQWSFPVCEYRIAKTEDQYPWDLLDPKFVCGARDEDGVMFVYDGKPSVRDDYWANTNIAAALVSGLLTDVKPGNKDWKDSLVWRPGCEPVGGEKP